jgi:hypothetical protein
MVDALANDGATVTLQVIGELDPVRVEGSVSATAVVMPMQI